MDKINIAYLYRVNRGLKDQWGVEGYKLPHWYEDPGLLIKARKKQSQLSSKDKAHFRRSTFVDEEQQRSRMIPGPSQYASEMLPPTVSVKKHSKSLTKLKDNKIMFRQNSFSELIKKKMSIPGIGQYDVTPTIENQEKQWEKYKLRKFKETQAPVIKEKYSHEFNVGPGLYNIHDKQFGKEASNTIISPMRKKMRSKSTVQLPSVHTYRPVPTYDNFQKSLLISQSKDKSKKRRHPDFGKAQRLPNPEKKEFRPSPASYNIVTQWLSNPKQKDPKKARQKNIFKSVSKLPERSIYYD